LHALGSGTNGLGAIFRLGKETVLYSFTNGGGAEGLGMVFEVKPWAGKRWCGAWREFFRFNGCKFSGPAG
jgi:hypothetical protein